MVRRIISRARSGGYRRPRYNRYRKSYGVRKVGYRRPYSARPVRGKYYRRGLKRNPMGKVVYRMDAINVKWSSSGQGTNPIIQGILKTKLVDWNVARDFYLYSKNAEDVASWLEQIRGAEGLTKEAYKLKGIKISIVNDTRILPFLIALKKNEDSNYLVKAKTMKGKIFMRFPKEGDESQFLKQLYVLTPYVSAVKIRFYFKKRRGGGYLVDDDEEMGEAAATQPLGRR